MSELSNQLSEYTMALMLMCENQKAENGGEMIIPLGVDEENNLQYQNFSSIPHMLVCGTTGSGKTSFIRSILALIAQTCDADSLRLVIYSSKGVDYSDWARSNLLIIPLINSSRKAAGAISWVSSEMEHRLDAIADGTNTDIPDLFLILDDYYDISSESCLTDMISILKYGRAAKIHCIIATSIPTAKVISTEMKANIHSRIAFATASKLDSRVIIDVNGAEKLHIPGEMLFRGPTSLKKCKSIFIPDDDIGEIIKRTISSVDETMNGNDAQPVAQHSYDGSMQLYEVSDDLYVAAKEVAIEAGKVSISILQRRLRVSYGTAARMIDRLESEGIVSAPDGYKPRTVLVKKD